MYRKPLIMVLFVVLCLTATAGMSGAKKKGSSGLSAWLTSIQKKISGIMPKKSLEMSTSVAGIRGSKEQARSKLYWKGKKGKESVTEAELTKFKAAVDLALKGDQAASAKELKDFMKLYPDSAMIPDAKKTLDMVQAKKKK